VLSAIRIFFVVAGNWPLDLATSASNTTTVKSIDMWMVLPGRVQLKVLIFFCLTVRLWT